MIYKVAILFKVVSIGSVVQKETICAEANNNSLSLHDVNKPKIHLERARFLESGAQCACGRSWKGKNDL